MEIQYANRIAYLDAQTHLLDLQNERIVQQRKQVESDAARHVLEEQLAQTQFHRGAQRAALFGLSAADRIRR